MQAQATNIGVACLEEYKLEAQKRELLLEAKEWLMQAHALAREDDFGGAVDLEGNLMLVHTWLGDLPEARFWLAKAERLAAAFTNNQELAMLQFDAVELEVASGDITAAKKRLQQAIDLFAELNTKQRLKIAQKRLSQLKASYPQV
jgi:tetratricopeptide (TPR) repeat protein